MKAQKMIDFTQIHNKFQEQNIKITGFSEDISRPVISLTPPPFFKSIKTKKSIFENSMPDVQPKNETCDSLDLDKSYLLTNYSKLSFKMKKRPPSRSRIKSLMVLNATNDPNNTDVPCSENSLFEPTTGFSPTNAKTSTSLTSSLNGSTIDLTNKNNENFKEYQINKSNFLTIAIEQASQDNDSKSSSKNESINDLSENNPIKSLFGVKLKSKSENLHQPSGK